MKKTLLILFSICFVVACQRIASEDTGGKVQEAIDKIKVKIQDNLGGKKNKEK